MSLFLSAKDCAFQRLRTIWVRGRKVQNTNWLMILVLVVAVFCHGQNQTVNSPTIDRHALMALEDAVANQFASIRKTWSTEAYAHQESTSVTPDGLHCVGQRGF